MKARALLVFVTLVLASVPASAAPRPLPPAQGWAKFMGLASFHPVPELRIETVRTASFAHVIGLRPGDVIVALNDFPITTLEGFQKVATWLAGTQPARWRFIVAREGFDEPLTVAAAPGFTCDPLKLIGCGPIPKR